MVGQLVPVDLYHAQRTDQRIAARPTAAAQKTTSPATPKGCTRLTAAVAGVARACTDLEPGQNARLTLFDFIIS